MIVLGRPVSRQRPFTSMVVSSLVEGFDKLIESRTGIVTTVADNAIACVAEGTGKSFR